MAFKGLIHICRRVPVALTVPVGGCGEHFIRASFSNHSHVAGIYSRLIAVSSVCSRSTAVSSVCSRSTAVFSVCSRLTAGSSVCSRLTAVSSVCSRLTAVSSMCSRSTAVSNVCSRLTAGSSVCSRSIAVSSVCSSLTAVSSVCSRLTAVSSVRLFHTSLIKHSHGDVLRCALGHRRLYNFHALNGVQTELLCMNRGELFGRTRCLRLESSAVWPGISPSVSQVRRRTTAATWKDKDSIPDLQRFLSEIGTDPKEGRFWLKQFQNVNQNKPFVVLEVHPQVFADASQLDHLASAVSFLQRNSLRPVLVLGDRSVTHTDHTYEQVKAVSTERCRALCDSLSEQNLEPCILFAGSGVLRVQHSESGGQEISVNPELLQWCMVRHSIPIIPSFGETAAGQIVQLTLWEVTSSVARQLQPFKIIKVNCHGGFKNEHGQIIANINLPFDFHAAKRKKWCTEPLIRTVREVSSLLPCLPQQTSVVITTADKLLQELFTHHGCGTFLKMMEPVLKYDSLEQVDLDRLTNLVSRSFKKRLSETYFDDIKNQVHTVFVSECYTAAAIICNVKGCDVPYLCKFAVTAQAQGEGTGEMLWSIIRHDFPRLFWRSRNNNTINHWYFKKSKGMWIINNHWTVFWYGITEPGASLGLIQVAESAPESFI